MADIPLELKELSQAISKARIDYPNRILAVCKEVIVVAFDISPAIGEISIEEADTVIIREFTERLRNG